MASAPLERIAVPFLRSQGLEFQECDDGKALVFRCETPAIDVKCAVLDLTFYRMLSIQIWNIVRFDTADTYRFELSNELTRRNVGRFVIDTKGNLDYRSELQVKEHTTPTDFEVDFRRSLVIVGAYYPAIMKVRWGGMTLDQALKRNHQRQDPSKRSKDVKRLIEEALQDTDSSK